MNNKQINKLESIAREGFLSAGEFAPRSGWQDEVIADIQRREHAGKFRKILPPQTLFQPRLVWRFAAVSLTIAVLMGITYLILPADESNNYQNNEVSFDNYYNYIEVIAQL